MNELIYFSDKLADINKEMGISSASGFLETCQSHLAELCYKNELNVDIITAINPTAEVRSVINNFNKSFSGIIPNIINKQNGFSKSITSSFATIAICLIDNEWESDNATEALLHLIKDQYKITLLINYLPSDTVAKQFSTSLGYKNSCKIIDAHFVGEKTIPEIIQEIYSPEKIKILVKLCQLNAVKPILTIINQVFQTENKTLQVRKLISIQNQQISRKEEYGSNTIELTNAVRQAIQKYSMEIDKNIKIKFEEFNKPITGGLSKVLQMLSNELTDFQRIDVAEKSEKVEIKLTPKFEDQYFKAIKNNIAEEMQKDKIYIKTATAELINRVNSLLDARKMPQIDVSKELIEFPNYKNSIQPYLQFNREFKSELIKKGTIEYFVALRDYTGIIMVATGLLAPLTIIANLSENGFLKHLSNGIKFGMAGITLFLIIYGVYDLRTRIPKKRKEEFDRELSKGKEFVVGEGKRISNDISRDWTNAVGNWTREISQIISASTEKVFKDIQTAKLDQMNKEKAQQQRQQQSADMMQRNLSNAEKVKDIMVNKLRDLINETEKSITL